jgi:hypothetical protein
VNWITGSILILHGRTPKIVIQPFDGSWKCQAESALEGLSDAAFWSSAISCTRRKVRAMQASLSIWSGAGFSTYRRSQDVGGQFGFRNFYLVGHAQRVRRYFSDLVKEQCCSEIRTSCQDFDDQSDVSVTVQGRSVFRRHERLIVRKTRRERGLVEKMDTLDAGKDTQTEELRARVWHEESDIRSRRTTAANSNSLVTRK